MQESSNYRPGEPLRNWLTETDVNKIDAVFTIQMADAANALATLIDGQIPSENEQIAYGRLNAYCVARWYEPMVELTSKPFISPDLAAFIRPIVTDLTSA